MAQSAWYYFAKNGDPNNELIPIWIKYDSTNRQTMAMDEAWSFKTIRERLKEKR